ncbi:MAG: DUF559 domain-containing protein, partial [Bacteroidales bacterium]|nr:DUF559 domain-containing protein [Bacteroidales bacterium]
RVIGEYIVDFYCRAAALVVELDGQQHEELDQHYADQVRDRKLEAEGLRVLRFRNQEVRYHLGRVCSAIEDAVTCPRGKGRSRVSDKTAATFFPCSRA